MIIDAIIRGIQSNSVLALQCLQRVRMEYQDKYRRLSIKANDLRSKEWKIWLSLKLKLCDSCRVITRMCWLPMTRNNSSRKTLPSDHPCRYSTGPRKFNGPGRMLGDLKIVDLLLNRRRQKMFDRIQQRVLQ